MRRRLAALALLIGSLVGVSAAQAQTPTTVTGRVTDAVSGAPLATVQIAIVGTNVGAVTNAQGVYTIRGVAAGPATLRILRVGYAEATQAVTVVAGQATTANFTLRPVALQLTPVVTTATGQQRSVEVPNSISSIAAATVVETSPVANINDLLTARAPGVQVLSSGATGTGARVRIRGTNSLSLNNDPVYIVDGVRIEASSTGQRAQAIGVGGSTGSRLNDLNPEDIESIEVVKGPSAATLYGTDAANGVIIIRTKRGRAGETRWGAYVEQGLVADRNTYPENYTGFGRLTANGARTANCNILAVQAGSCTRDSLGIFNPINNDETTIIGNGYRQQYGLQASGGSDAVQYFVAGEFEGEDGFLKLPDVERDRLRQTGRAIPDYVERPNALQRYTGRANLTTALRSDLDLALNLGFTQSNQRLPNLDNNLFSPIAQALFAQGTRTRLNAAGDGPLLATTGPQLNGYLGFPIGDVFEEAITSDVNRFLSSANVNYRPLGWLTTRGAFGLDYTSRRETDICRFATCADNGTTRLGFAIDDRSQIYQYTADVSGTADFMPFPTISSSTSIGTQLFSNRFQRARSTGTTLPPGAQTPASGSVPTVQSATDENRTLGAYIEQVVGWRERLYLTAAVRYDENSANGAQFSGSYNPRVGASWVLSDEEFFPQTSWINQFRLRSALGESSVRPGTNDAIQFFSGGGTATARLASADVPGLAIFATGNADLRPETTREFEAGMDGTLFSNRLNFEFTYYNKSSRDALIARVLPPSLGAGATTRFENLGSVTNKGVEALLGFQPVQTDAFAWDATISGSFNSNRLVDLGGVPPQIGATVQQRAGYALNGYWQRQYTYADTDANGIITVNELTVDDSATFVGYSQPRTEVVFVNGFEFFNRRLRLQTLVDFKGGHHLYNNTERFKCVDAANCRGRQDETSSLFEQARSVAATTHPSRTLAGFMEKADFVRFREVALTYTLSPELATRLVRGRSLGVTLSARNLGLLTDYTGIDPESSYGQTDIPSDFLTLPPPTYFTFRLNVGF